MVMRNVAGEQLIMEFNQCSPVNDLGRRVADDLLVIRDLIWVFQKLKQDDRRCLPERLLILVRRRAEYSVNDPLRLVAGRKTLKIRKIETELFQSGCITGSDSNAAADSSSSSASTRNNRPLPCGSLGDAAQEWKTSDCSSRCKDLAERNSRKMAAPSQIGIVRFETVSDFSQEFEKVRPFS